MNQQAVDQLKAQRDAAIRECDELREKVAALETSMPPVPEFLQVGTVQHLHELNDGWLAKLPVGEKLYTMRSK